MKSFSKIVVYVLTISVMVSAIFSGVGCRKTTPNDENSLELYATSAGYGIKWIEELIPIFEQQHPNSKVYLNYDIGVELCRNKVLSGPGANTADLLVSLEDWQSVVLQGNKGVSGYSYALEDLTDFLDEGDSSLRSQFLPYYLNATSVEIETSAGNYQYRDFAVPWVSSYLGIVYNKTLFDENPSWKIPNTTDELLQLCDTIKATGKTPLANETKTGYIDYMTSALFAQYMGIDEYYDYYNPITEDDYYKYTTSSDEAKARLYSMYVMNDLLNPSNARLSPTAQEDDYGRAQGRLISGEGAMIIIGDWFDKEMALTIEQAKKAGKNYESGMMRVPVISALSEKLSYWKTFYPSNDYKTARSGSAESGNLAKCDEMLSKIVDYIDAGKAGDLPTVDYSGGVATCNQSDVVIVEKAISCYSSLGAGHTLVIPSYASAKELAKEFIRLLFSEQGIEIFLNTTSGGALPVQYDVTRWNGYNNASSFQKEVYELTAKGTAVQHPSSLTWRVSGLPEPVNKKFFQYRTTDSGYKSPDSYFISDSLSKAQFIDLMRSAGLL